MALKEIMEKPAKNPAEGLFAGFSRLSLRLQNPTKNPATQGARFFTGFSPLHTHGKPCKKSCKLEENCTVIGKMQTFCSIFIETQQKNVQPKETVQLQ